MESITPRHGQAPWLMQRADVSTRQGFCRWPSLQDCALRNTPFFTGMQEQPRPLLTQPEARDSQSGFPKVSRKKRKLLENIVKPSRHKKLNSMGKQQPEKASPCFCANHPFFCLNGADCPRQGCGSRFGEVGMLRAPPWPHWAVGQALMGLGINPGTLRWNTHLM